MDIGQNNWQEADADNNSAPPDGFPTGMFPSGENTGARAMMGAIKRWFNRNTPKLTTGTSVAYLLAYSVAPAAYVDGETYLVRFDQANTTASPTTLNINGLGALPIYKYVAGAWVAIGPGDIAAAMICRLSYNQSAGALFILTSSASAIGAVLLGVVANFTAAINAAMAPPIASAGTVNIGAAAGNTLHITGTTTITAFDVVQAGARRTLIFDGILTLTDGAALLLPTGASIVTAAGDVAELVSEGAGNWRCVDYQRADGTALVVAPKVAAPVRVFTSTNPSGTAAIPNQTTAPTNTQGSDIFGAVSFTALNAAHRIRVTSTGTAGNASGIDNMSVALFIDGGANPVSCTTFRGGQAQQGSFTLLYEAVLSAGAHTFNLRGGGNSAGQFILNGDYGAGPLFGSTVGATLIIEELNAP